jgi:hypothetical protein
MEKVREEEDADVVSEVGRSNNKLEEWPGRRVLRDRAATEAMVNKEKKAERCTGEGDYAEQTAKSVDGERSRVLPQGMCVGEKKKK